MANKRLKIDSKTSAELWWRAAGRCEFRGCQKPLYLHGVTYDPCNISNMAHIIGASKDGPRGDSPLPIEERNHISNIMLLCPECHHYIDHEGKDKHSDEQLREMKRLHEQRMEYLTGLNPNRSLEKTFCHFLMTAIRKTALYMPDS